MTTLSTLDHPVPQELAGGERLVRNFLFLASFLLAWFTVSPFPDLGSQQAATGSTGGDLASQASAVLMTGALALYVLIKRPALLPRAITLPLVVTLAAFAVSAVLSSYPDVAERRLVLAIFNDLSRLATGAIALRARTFCPPIGGRSHHHSRGVLFRRGVYAAALDPSGNRHCRTRPCRRLARLLHPQKRRRRRHGGADLHRHFRPTVPGTVRSESLHHRARRAFSSLSRESKSPIRLLPMVLVCISYLVPRLRSSPVAHCFDRSAFRDASVC